MRNIVLSTSLFIMTISLYSQGVADAVRWSLLSPGGTARTLGVGGSFGAMGGDFSVININPAGIGEYKKSEFTITPSIVLTESKSFFKADPTKLKTYQSSAFALDNAALVISTAPGGRWVNSNFTIGFSKIADLNRSFEISGDTKGSITNRFAERANGKVLDDLDDFEAWPAYKVGAIYDVNGDRNYTSDVLSTDNLSKYQLVNQEGQISEFSMGWAGNYENKMNIGFSMGIPFVTFNESKQYTEDDVLDEIPLFNELKYDEFLSTTGVGINFKAGFTYKASNKLRIGAAIHSPTWYTLTDDYSTNIEFVYYDQQILRNSFQSPAGSFKYAFSNPWRAVGSIGSIYNLGKIKGFVNADLEFVDYTSSNFNLAKFSNDPGEITFSQEVNRDINRFLGRATILRLGTELAYSKVRFRIGTEQAQSPFNADAGRFSTNSFGFGLREDKFFIDLGVQYRSRVEGYLPYTVLESENDPLANVNLKKTRIVLTTGFKF